MATYKCSETDIRALFLESHDDPAPVFESCPESCEFLFGTTSPQLFDIHQGLFIQGILTLLFYGPYLLAFWLSSSSGRRKLRRLFNCFFVLQLAVSVPTLLIATASLFDVNIREAGEPLGASGPSKYWLNNGGVLPSIPDLLVADAAVQLQIFATAVMWCTLWLRYVLDSYDTDARRLAKKAAGDTPRLSSSDDGSSGTTTTNNSNNSNNRLRALRLSPHRSNKQRARHVSDHQSHKGFFITVIAFTASLVVTGVFGPWYLVQRLYHISAPNVALAGQLCGPRYAGLAVDPAKIDAVPNGVHVLIVSLLLVGVLVVSILDQSAQRCRLVMAAGLVTACAFAHGFVLSSMVSLARIRTALVAVLGDEAGVGNVTSAARVLAVVIWLPVVVGLLAWFWRAVVVAAGLCPSFISKQLPPASHPPCSLWRFNPRAKSLSDRFRLLAPDDDDNIFGGHLAAYDLNPSQEHIHLGRSNKGSLDGRASQMPRGLPKVFSGFSESWRGKAGDDDMKRATAQHDTQHEPMSQRELQDLHVATMGLTTMGVSSRGLPMQAPTTWV